MTAYLFPPNFVWGVATSAPQIEGGATLDGKGESVWDRFACKPGNVANGDTPDVACDHYTRFRDDFALMSQLGIKHYRLSIAWPRIFPDGGTELNQRGVDFYHRIFDALEVYGITPWVTMFHWDLPQALEDRGGWRNRELVGAFARYANTLVREYRDRVKHWITLNEIPCFTDRGYGGGNKAPGLNEGPSVVNQTFHHALLCHGVGVTAVRTHGAKGSQVGFAENPEPSIPLSDSAEDIRAASDLFVSGGARVIDPILRGHYSADYLSREGKAAPRVQRGDLEIIAQPVDFVGLNLYSASFVRADQNGHPERVAFSNHYPRADSSWLRLTPEVMYWAPRFLAENYGAKSIYITENGCGYDDEQVSGDECYDLHRRVFLRSYLQELHRATGTGIPVNGYFHWSFLDNFEWQDGYTRRFGLCHVDFKTQKRTPKLSAHCYSRIIRANGL